MKKHLTLLIFLISMVGWGNALALGSVYNLKDSIGVEKVGNNVFILHKVEAKETLYSLSRRYQAEIKDIIQYNPEAESGLKVGAVLKIPYKIKEQSTAVVSHVVEPSQTLFSISRIYQVSVEDIKKWNNLNSNDLNVGQTLVINPEGKGQAQVKTPASNTNLPKPTKEEGIQKTESGKIVHKVAPSQTLYAISQLYGVTVDEIKQWNNLKDNTLDVGRLLIIKADSKPHPHDSINQPRETMEVEEQEKVVRLDNKIDTAPKPSAENVEEKKSESKKENSSGFKKVVELGLAEIIESNTDTKKYVALHRTAPIGTIMQVTNEMNNQNVFVRVIGKLPATGANEKVLIKLSKPAFERLGAVNDRFPAEISYVP